jgi:hypothetical protein
MVRLSDTDARNANFISRVYRTIRRQLSAFRAKPGNQWKNDILKIWNISEIHIDFFCAVANIESLGDLGGRRTWAAFVQQDWGNACAMG